MNYESGSFCALAARLTNGPLSTQQEGPEPIFLTYGCDFAYPCSVNPLNTEQQEKDDRISYDIIYR